VYTEVWWGKLRVKEQMDDPFVDGRIILRWIFKKWDVGLWTESNWFKLRTGGEHL
jgi:hypothetical protein